MNAHEDIRKQLAAYGGGDLQPAERIRVEEHLAVCASCRTELADLQTVLRLMQTTPEAEPPAWLATRIMARVRQQQREKRHWLQRIFFPLHVKLPLEVAALVLVSVSGYYMARTVETELKQPTIRGEMSAETPQAGQLPVAPEPMAPPATPPVSTPQAPAADNLPQSGATISGQSSAPKAANQAAPRSMPATTGSPSQPPAFAPAPPAMKEERGAPTAEPMYESTRPSQDNQRLESAESALPAAGEMKKKARSMGEQDRAAGEGLHGASGKAAVAPPQVKIRLRSATPAAASGLVTEAVIRTGGSIIDGGPMRHHSLRAYIAAARMGELVEQLGRLGTVLERPQVSDTAGLMEIEITW